MDFETALRASHPTMHDVAIKAAVFRARKLIEAAFGDINGCVIDLETAPRLECRLREIVVQLRQEGVIFHPVMPSVDIDLKKGELNVSWAPPPKH